MTRRPPNQRRGFMFLDAVVALLLLATIGLLLVATRGGLARLDRRNADRAAAVRMAETYLVEHAGPTTRPTHAIDDWVMPSATQPAATPPVPTFVDWPSLKVVPLPTTAPAGWQWVSVRADVRGRVGEIVGLVRSEP